MTSRFSDYFGPNKSQAELDFVDIPLTNDLPLYLDPYTLSLEDADWFASCNDLVVNFFELIIELQVHGADGSHRYARPSEVADGATIPVYVYLTAVEQPGTLGYNVGPSANSAPLDRTVPRRNTAML